MAYAKTILQLEDGEKVMRDVGECVYCGSKLDLSKEHVIPYGLNGTLVLTNASCPEHARITSRFEGVVLRKHLLLVRAGLEMKTRRKRDRPKEFHLTIKDADGQRKILLSKEDQPILLAMPKFGPPGLPSSIGSTSGIDIGTTPYIAQVAGPPVKDFLNELGKSSSRSADFIFDMQPVDFARMLAKIGYTATVGEFGLEGIHEASCLPAVLGDEDRIGHWVGIIDSKNRVLDNTGLHRIVLEIDKSAIMARVKLFAFAGTPEYVVVVGKPTENLLSKFGISK